MIYRLALDPPKNPNHNKSRLKNCGESDTIICWPDRDPPKPPGICRTCKQIRAETLSIWYGEHKFCLMSWSTLGAYLPVRHYCTGLWWDLWDIPYRDGPREPNLTQFLQKWLSKFPEDSLKHFKRLDLELYANIIYPHDALRRVWEIYFSTFPQGTAALETGHAVSVKRTANGQSRKERVGMKWASPRKREIERFDKIVDVLQRDTVDYRRPCFKNVNIFLLFGAFEADFGQDITKYRADVQKHMDKYVDQKFLESS